MVIKYSSQDFSLLWSGHIVPVQRKFLFFFLSFFLDWSNIFR